LWQTTGADDSRDYGNNSCKHRGTCLDNLTAILGIGLILTRGRLIGGMRSISAERRPVYDRWSATSWRSSVGSCGFFRRAIICVNLRLEKVRHHGCIAGEIFDVRCRNHRACCARSSTRSARTFVVMRPPLARTSSRKSSKPRLATRPRCRTLSRSAAGP
jgi:hypothetical protein